MEKELKEKLAEEKLKEILNLIKEGKIKPKKIKWFHKLFSPLYLSWLRFCDKYIKKEENRFRDALKRLKNQIEKDSNSPT